MHALIVGNRGVGKSTLIRRVVNELNVTISGYETRKEDSLADEIKGSPVYIYEAGKPHEQKPENLLGYCKGNHPKIEEHAFDRAAYLISGAKIAGDLVVMDEIGFMEDSSELFRAQIMRQLDGNTPVIAAVKNKETKFLTSVKTHPNCRCFLITEDNRDELVAEVLSFVRPQLEIARISNTPAAAVREY